MILQPAKRLQWNLLKNTTTNFNLQQQFYCTNTERLVGKVAVITGAASGVGKAAAAEFINNGAKVILADIQQDMGRSIASELGPNATFIACDVTQEPQVAAAIDFAVDKYGRLDIMYNNTGISGSIIPSITTLDFADFDRVMAINVRGVLAGIKHAARVMVPRQSGCILCTASIAGLLGGITPHGYSISKSAVIGAVRTAASELSSHGIRINCISPFALPTPFSIEAMSKMFPGVDVKQLAEMVYGAGPLQGTRCEVEDIAKAAVFLASDDAKYVSGHNLVVDGGFTSFKSLDFPSRSEH